jgi:hypothetical protein
VVARREMLLDEQGFTDLSAELNGLLERVKEIERESADRMEATDEDDGAVNAGLVMMMFEAGQAQVPVQRDGRSRPRPRPRSAAKH